MYPANEGMPSTIAPLETLLGEADSSTRPEKVFIGHNLGHRTFMALIPMKDFYSMSKVANERQPDGSPATQRPLNEAHATGLAKYILRGLLAAAIEYRKNFNKPESPALFELQRVMGPQAYMSLQPIIANLRTCNPGGAGIEGRRMECDGETACYKVYLGQRDLLYVIDGQHRRYAMDLVFEFLSEIRINRKYPRKPKLFDGNFKDFISPEVLAAWDECDEVARGFCRIAVEIHLGLGVREEQQLFHDLNNLSKKVEKSLALKFDSANPVNRFIQQDLLPMILEWEDVADGDQTNWNKDTGRWTFKDLAAVNAIMFLNRTSIATATPSDVEEKQDVASRMWSAVKEIKGFGDEGAKSKTVAAQPVVVKAIAKLVYDLGFGRGRSETADADLDKLLSNIHLLNWSHNNPVWRFYQMSEADRVKAKLTGLRDYLPDGGATNRDIGSYDKQTGWMKFGTRHNDIYPIIGDMIRWQLQLPSRHAVKDAA
ncbi:DNA sulfur modification protein [Pseudomonas phage vB_PpS_SYP]|nr:DNA sulfur modification protein [Pseudomonas phage vB_PpS_SYP]